MPKKKNFIQRNPAISIFLGILLVVGTLFVFGVGQQQFGTEDRIRHDDDKLPRVIGETDEYVEVKNDPRSFEVHGKGTSSWTPNDLGEGRNKQNGTISLSQSYSNVGSDDGLTLFSGEKIVEDTWYPVESFNAKTAFSFYLVTDFEEWSQPNVEIFNKSGRCKVTDLRPASQVSQKDRGYGYSIQGTECEYKFSYQAEEKFTDLTKDGIISSIVRFPRVNTETDISESQCLEDNDCSGDKVCSSNQICEFQLETFFTLNENNQCVQNDLLPQNADENDFKELADCELEANQQSDDGSRENETENETSVEPLPEQPEDPSTGNQTKKTNQVTIPIINQEIPQTLAIILGLAILVILIVIGIIVTSNDKK